MLPLDNGGGGCKQQGGTQLKSVDQALCHGKYSLPAQRAPIKESSPVEGI